MPHNSTNGTNGIDSVNGNHDINGRRPNRVPHTASDDMSNSIAIVGISCKFGGAASNLDSLWHTLASGASCWSQIPKSRFDVASTYHPDPLRTDSLHVKGGFFIEDDLTEFDAPFFNLTADAAKAMDPQLRLLLEGVYQATESAGIPTEKLSGTNTSVFSASFGRDYNEMLMKDADTLPTSLVTGNGPAMFANRVSHFYNLQGPSVTVDTGCSGGLVALHMGVNSIRNHESEISIVGASNAILNQDFFIAISNLGLLHEDGKCYSMDHRWGGYGRGEGMAVLVLKKFSEAVKDGDYIHAVIRESAVNQDGRTGTITSPSMEAQRTLIQQCYSRAGIDLASTGYVEAHLTGTGGDVIEAEALARTFGHARDPSDPVWVGSVKSNIGHTEPVSGLAAVVKAALMLRHKQIPAQVTFEKANPNIPLQDWKLQVPTSLTPWPQDKPLRISVNNFGYGGTNAHLILDAPPDVRSRQALSNGNGANINSHESNGMNYPFQAVAQATSLVYMLTAKEEAGAVKRCKDLAQYIRKALQDGSAPAPGDLAYTLAERRSRFSWTVAVKARSLEQLAEILEDPRRQPSRAFSSPVRIGYVFNGQGAQWHAMGRELMMVSEVFSSSIDQAEAHLQAFGALWSLREELCRDARSTQVHEIELSQPLSVVVQLCLVDLLRSWNITPAAVVSHSSGEIAAAYAAGVLSFKEAVGVVYHRGRLAKKYQKISALSGGMMAVGLGAKEAQEYISNFSSTGRVVIACINSPDSVTISGDLDALEEVAARLEADDVFARKLKVPLAYHSHHMEFMAKEYQSCLEELLGPAQGGDLEITFASPVTGGIVTSRSIFGAAHWVRNLTSPVLFSSALESLVFGSTESDDRARALPAPGHRVSVFLEIGAHDTLSGPVRQTLRETRVPYLTCLKRPLNAVDTMQDVVCALVVRGYPVHLESVNKSPLNASRQSMYVHDLPEYPWNHQASYRLEPRASEEHRLKRFKPHELLGRPVPGTNPLSPTWRNFLRTSDIPWLVDHQLESSVVLPGAGYISMAIEAMRLFKGSSNPDAYILQYYLRDVDIVNALIIPHTSSSSNRGTEIHFSLRPCSDKDLDYSDWYEFELWSVSTTHSWIQHCKGSISARASTITSLTKVSPSFLGAELPHQKRFDDVKPETLYKRLRDSGFHHGPTFQNIIRSRVCQDRSETEIAVAPVAFECEQQYVIHPTTLDSIFQCCYASIPADLTKDAMFIPRSIGGVTVSSKLGVHANQKLLASLDCLSSGPRGSLFKGSVCATGADDDKTNGVSHTGTLEMQNFRLQRVTQASAGTRDSKSSHPQIHSKNGWELDIHYGIPDDIKDSMRIRLSQSELEFARNIREVSYHHISNALQHLGPQINEKWTWYHKKFFQWIITVAQAAELGTLMPGSDHWSKRSDASKQGLYKEVANTNASGEMVHRIGIHLCDIIQGKLTPLELMMEDGLLNRYYEELPQLCNGSYKHLRKVMELYSVVEPGARVIEIGGGTGGATSVVLDAFAARSEHESGASLLGHYDFTDISSGFFGAAKTKFATWGDMISYSKLDIEQDPLGQGFPPHSYDLVVASHVLHATTSLKRTLSHVRKLLRPGGQLVLLEGSQDSLDVQLIFGTVENWWLSEEPERQTCPYVNLQVWDEALISSGFTGLEFEIGDCENPEVQFTSTILTHAKAQDPSYPSLVSIVVPSSSEPQDWLNQLVSTVQDITESAPVVESLGEVEAMNDRLLIMALDNQTPFIDTMDSEAFEKLRHLSLNSKGILWLSFGGAIDNEDPRFAQIAGLFRTLRREDPSRRYVQVSCERPQQSFPTETIRMIRHVFKQSFEYSTPESANIDWEYSVKDQRLYVPRLYPDFAQDRAASEGDRPPQLQEFNSSGKTLVFQPPISGSSAGVTCFVETFSTTDDLPSGFAEIEPRAFGLNIAGASEELQSIAHEGSGVIRRLGPDTQDSGLLVGDRVCGIFQGPISNASRAHWTNMIKVPDNLSWAEAASAPYAYATAWLALHDLARLQKHERVLLHFATAGVGQAAFALAKNIGAEIFVICNTDEERRILQDEYNLSPGNILPGEAASLIAAITSETKGQGVDVTLSSVNGPLLKASWECTAPFGRFVQIGKADAEKPKQLDMSPFARGVSMTGLDTLQYSELRGAMMHRALGNAMGFLRQQNTRHTAPLKIFKLAEVEKALQYVRGGSYAGGAVVLSHPGDEIYVIPKTEASLGLGSPDSTYLIVGGLGGIGLATANWMMEQGAKNLLVVSRNAVGHPKGLALAQNGKEFGCSIHLRNCDISDEAAVVSLLAKAKDELPPIRGVLQIAAVLDDTVFERMTFEQWQNAIGPKVTGTWALHNNLSDLDFFITTSSATGVLGNVSQSNYTAGGTFQDAFARYRTSLGLPAVTIDLGPIDDVGYVAQGGDVVKNRVEKALGMKCLPIAHVLRLFEDAIRNPYRGHPESSQIITCISGYRTLVDDPAVKNDRRLGTLRLGDAIATETPAQGQSEASKGIDGLVSQLPAMTASEDGKLKTLITELLVAKVSDLFNLERSDIDTGDALTSIGVDSLVAVDFRNWLGSVVKAKVSIFEILQTPALSEFAGLVAERTGWVVR
ncbi:polyketide synthase [Stemphylium lycopersici]|uniref:Polyketide synthase PksH n=1 Tax=Stemphylium lycopersici TaxID=183478 RepID=A0A364NES9_STELY|nr:polyketide synthase [Stemphylium lycopersici]RAR15818.1 polyketide synthase PksH [Stemphylium lycopersici]